MVKHVCLAITPTVFFFFGAMHGGKILLIVRLALALSFWLKKNKMGETLQLVRMHKPDFWIPKTCCSWALQSSKQS